MPDYPNAIALLTKLQRQPEFPDRARAQELLGLARERAGQLAHAKAEYEEYLRRYPQGEAAERVTFRLRILRAAEAKARTGRSVGDEAGGWELSGGFGQIGALRRFARQQWHPASDTPLPPAAETDNENALFTDLDLLARRRVATPRPRGAHSQCRLRQALRRRQRTGAAGRSRVSLASVEALDRPLGLLVRLGRQAHNEDGILGTFDGLFASWQLRPASAESNAAVGFPLEQLTVTPQTQERFETLALAFTPPNAHWDGSLFVAQPGSTGLADRQAVGAERPLPYPQRASLVTV